MDKEMKSCSHNGSNQSLEPTQHFVVSFRSIVKPIVKVLRWLGSFSLDRMNNKPDASCLMRLQSALK